MIYLLVSNNSNIYPEYPDGLICASYSYYKLFDVARESVCLAKEKGLLKNANDVGLKIASISNHDLRIREAIGISHETTLSYADLYPVFR